MSNRGRQRNKTVAPMPECLRIATEQRISAFASDPTQNTLEFPATLTSEHRASVHALAEDYNLISKSRGKGFRRFITLFKKQDENTPIELEFEVATETKEIIFELLKKQPLKPNEIANLQPDPVRNLSNKISPYRLSVGSLQNSLNSVPPNCVNPSMVATRQGLPIFGERQRVISTIASSQVVLISGETGSGKTTQVPQYILEECAAENRPCRIICAQPRRLSAISIAERVAYERGEEIGKTVGYQVRLESRTSPGSNLIYCTNGVFVRCLMGGTMNELFQNVTHIIIDEVHERDKFSDFLLISIREGLALNPAMRVILMSATMDAKIFLDYFNYCQVIDVSGRMFPVHSFFLEDVLLQTKYTNSAMQRARAQLNRTASDQVYQIPTEYNLDDETIKLLDQTFEVCWHGTSEDAFEQFFYLVEGESVSVNYKHSETGMTALMMAAAKGYAASVQILLALKADPMLQSVNGLKAIDWSIKMNHPECEHQLRMAGTADRTNNPEIDPEAKKQLDLYTYNRTEEDIDQELLFAVIRWIHLNQPAGSILVFLTGYDEIIKQNDKILEGIASRSLPDNIKIIMLHSNMQVSQQREAFRPANQGMRKVILSTNIAESSITIDDVLYVIDGGRVKQKSFDSISGSNTLSSTWISKACATQRTGRAGRTSPGICFRLYSTKRFNSMDAYTLPEILRVALTEICLNTKLIAPNYKIADYLGKAIQAPPKLSMKQSVTLLQTLGALDADENITALGVQLGDLPVDVQYGKMLLYAIVLKCVDPVLTIVAALSVKDPFVLPSIGDERRRATSIKQSFSGDACSDHIALLKVFQQWINSKASQMANQFCRQNYVSAGSMEMICGVRTQILGHLRAVGLVKSRGPRNMHDLNVNAKCWAAVKACITAGLYPNVCYVDQTQQKINYRVRQEPKIMPHASSFLRAENAPKTLPSQWLMFGEKSRVGRLALMKCNTFVTAATLTLFGGPIQATEQEILSKLIKPNNKMDNNWDDDEDDANDVNGENIAEMASNSTELSFTRYAIDDWLAFSLDTDTAYFLFHLRQKFHAIFLKLLQNVEQYYFSKNDMNVIGTIVRVLTAEDRASGLAQPFGVGDRPKAVMLDLGADLNYGVQDNCERRSSTKHVSPQEVNDFMRDNVTVTQNDDSFYRNRYDDRRPSNRDRGGWGGRNQNWVQRNNGYQDRVMTGHSNERRPNRTMKTRYYVVRAATCQQVDNTFQRRASWQFAESVFQMMAKNSRSNEKAIIFFHIASARRYYCVGQFCHSRDGGYVEMVSNKYVLFNATHFERCYDGQELSESDGAQFLMQFGVGDPHFQHRQ